MCDLRPRCIRRSIGASIGGTRMPARTARVADRGLPARAARRAPPCGERDQARRPPHARVGEIALPRRHRRQRTLLDRPRREPLLTRTARRHAARRRRRPGGRDRAVVDRRHPTGR